MRDNILSAIYGNLAYFGGIILGAINVRSVAETLFLAFIAGIGGILGKELIYLIKRKCQNSQENQK